MDFYLFLLPSLFSVQAPPSKASEVLVSLCSSGKLIAFISSYQAQFVTCEGSMICTQWVLHY